MIIYAPKDRYICQKSKHMVRYGANSRGKYAK